MTCIESHKETVQSASRPHSLNLKGLQARPALESPPIPTFPSAWNGAEAIIKPAIVIAAAGVLLWTLLSGDFWRFHSLPDQTMFGRVTWGVAMGYGLIVFLALIWRLRLWSRYRPMEAVEDADLPSVTVVIPAYNEGSLVRDSILSAAASRYPSDRMEIIVIDDGSSDDTWSYIRSAAREVGSHVNIRTFRQPRNKGKRQALYLGFMRARGDVFVTIDSDSVLEPDALRNAVTPLVRDPSVDCVAGCVQVMNPRQNLFTRFLKVYFSLSFKFVRAYQNEFRGVFCTPGALSVYREDVVRRVADEWLDQQFLGLPCATGEDRSMTNLILREGGLTAYQGNAVVWSKAPDNYRDMVNMFLRWARSNIRETIVLWRFMFSRFRSRFVNTFRLNMVIVLLSLVMPPLLIAHSAALLATSDGFFVRYLGVTLIFASIMSVIYYRNERDHDWIWLLVYNFFWITSLSWILPYAAVTLRNTRWLTRGADDQDPDARRNPSDTELAELLAN
ncbi:MAG: glycosyltransferase [Phycisphaerae bacterium]